MEGVDEEVSNEVDKRIIEMEFKNDQFEKEASKTLNTLDALKQKLNNNFSTKGAEELNQAIKSVDVSPLSKGIEAIQFQFSALQIAGKRVIENIVDAAMNAIGNVKNKLTGVINQIKVGGSNRAQNIENAKFMLSGLGIEWKDIVDDINYGVQDTAYGLDAAAKVASQLVASNVSLGQDMQSSLRGVSGVAAMTNSTYEEIGHIFTSIAGQGKLMTMQLQQFSLRGLNVAADLAKSMGTTEAAVREMVTKGQIDFMTFAKAMDNLYGEHAKDANKTFTGALSNTRAALSRLGADIAAKRFETIRQVLVKIIPKLKELKTAMKPVEDGINSAMEAVGKLVEYLVDRINVPAIVESIAPKIQRVTEFVKEFADTAREYIQNLDNTKPGKFVKNLQDMADTTEKIVEFTKEEIELAKDIWNIGIAGNGEERVRYIEALGDKYKNTQAAVDKFIDSGYNWDALVVKTEEDTQAAGGALVALGTAAGVNGGSEKKPTTIYLIIDALYNLSRVIKNVVGSAVNIVSVIKDAFKEVFTPQGVAGQVNTFAGILADISDKLYVTKSDVEQFKPLITFIFNIMKSLAKVILTLAKWALVAANKLADIFNKIRNSEIVKKILDTIGKAIGVITDKFKILFNYLKSSGLLDRFVNILKVIAEWIGVKIANAFVFLANHSTDIVVAIANGFEWIVEHVEKLIQKLQDAGGLFPAIKDFFLNGVDVGKSWIEKIAGKLSALFSNDGEDKESLFKKAYERAAAWGKGIIAGLNSITWDDIKEAGGLVFKLYSLISLLNLVGSWTTINKGITKFFKGLGEFFSSLTSLTKATALRTVASAIESLGRTLLMIVTSIIALTLLVAYAPGGDEAVDKAIRIVRDLVILIGFFEVLLVVVEKTKLANKGKKISITLNARKLAMAAMLTSLATFMWTFFSYIKFMTKGLTSEDSDSFTDATIATLRVMLVLFGVITLVVVTIMHEAEKLKGSLVGPELLNAITKTINAMTKAMFKLMITIGLLTFIFSHSDPKAIKKAIWTFVGVVTSLLVLVGWAALISANMTEAKAKDVEIITNFFSVFSGAMTMLMLSLAALAIVFNKVSTGSIIASLVAFGAIVAALVGGLFLINKINITNENAFNEKMKGITKIATMITLVIGAFSGLALSLGLMKQLGASMDDMITMMIGMGALIVAIIGIAGLVGLIPGASTSFVAMGTALTGFGVAMLSIAGAVLGLALAFKIVIDILPKFVSAFETFHNEIMDKKDIVVAGIGDLIGVIAAGLFAGIIEALNQIIYNMKPIIDAVINTIIAICSVLGASLKENSGELGKAIGDLVEGIVVVLVDALGQAIRGIVMGLWDAIEDIKAYLGLNGTEDYDEYGQTEDAYVESAMLPRLKSDKVSELDKKAVKIWLKEHGYDEEGNRTADWLELHTKVPYSELMTFEEAKIEAGAGSNKGDWYSKYYGGKSKTSEQIKEIKEDTQAAEKESEEAKDSLSGLVNNTEKMSSLAEKGKEYLSSTNNIMGNIDLSKTQEGFGEFSEMFKANAEATEDAESFGNFSALIHEEAEATANSTEEYNAAVKQKTDMLENSIKDMATGISTTLEGLAKDSEKYGADIVAGFVAGMCSIASIVKLKTASLTVTNAVREAFTGKEGLDERSPSHVMEKYGVYAILGFANGITNSISTATEATQSAGEATILSMRETLKRMSLEASNSIDTNPRITPVLDLSNVTEGIGLMDSMIDTSHAVRLGAITSTEASANSSRRISAIYQNGSNFDDTNTVGAITSLQGEVSTLKDAINGMQVVMDGKALVGQIVTPMDKALGRKVLAGRRKV